MNLTNSKLLKQNESYIEREDKYFMQQALSLAKKGKQTATPNPVVGCVIVRNRKIIGKGYHHLAGQAHAEINALADAKSQNEDVSGATAYVTLEPCDHHGKTPPCSEALIKSGIARVVIGSEDPNRLVSGKGITHLKNVGISVTTNCLKEECEKINNGFLKRMRCNLPYVSLKIGMSLDGKIATKTGESKWITGELARRDVQLLRSESCAILTSSNTVIADDSQLNVRLNKLNNDNSNHQVANSIPQNIRQPIRVLLDKDLKVVLNKPHSRIFQTPGKVIVFHHSKNIINNQLINNAPCQIELVYTELKNENLDLKNILSRLAEYSINELLIEAGSQLSGAFITENLVDELVIYQAPIILGHEAKSVFNIPNVNKLSDNYQFKFYKWCKIGEDLKIIYRHPNSPNS